MLFLKRVYVLFFIELARTVSEGTRIPAVLLWPAPVCLAAYDQVSNCLPRPNPLQLEACSAIEVLRRPTAASHRPPESLLNLQRNSAGIAHRPILGSIAVVLSSPGIDV
jgi:hypothetical protein